ncbi:hypothetical protein I7I50_00582 [Histoplasma capsulatum G186AR]|uniref:Uncharacterized protein n=1 Tax=Ajellomyces capsulatus TaxID=5037 RepID=A0A8H7YGB9_AJECA|nr:hypothetical protein I7I52_07850 [Histoplasma capsulatum]QSS72664.1 hypothetical protein I7I50_00582 [Histoplasma capsulatum G186AR]
MIGGCGECVGEMGVSNRGVYINGIPYVLKIYISFLKRERKLYGYRHIEAAQC